MDTGLEALTTALYVTVDDLLNDHPEQAPARPAVGLAPLTSDAEVITLAVVQALLGYISEARWLRRVGSDGGDGPVDQQDVGGVLPVGADTGQQVGAHSWFPSSASRR